MSQLLKGTICTLEAMLEAKEERYKRQQAWLSRFNKPLVSITINMPGAVKDSPVSVALCDYAVREVKKRLPVFALEVYYKSTGPEAILAIAAEANLSKSVCTEIEAAHSFGRLLDLDVFSAAGELLSAQAQRGLRSCYVCNQPAVICMREARHSQSEIRQGVLQLVYEFLAESSRNYSSEAADIGALAVEAMLYEVSCTPSPGLVNRIHSGAHQDMDFYSFMTSSAALASFMARFAEAGRQFTGEIRELFPVLRFIGKEAESAMFQATKGVNTQKGLIFSLGIVAAIVAWLEAKQEYREEKVYETIALMTAGLVETELADRLELPESKLTAGEKLYRRYKIAGIRGEMEQGLPAIRCHALPQLRLALAKGLTVNDALIETLLRLMTCVDDTTVMNRHSPDKMRQWVKRQVEPIFTAGGLSTAKGKALLQSMDELFVKSNISPGGAADLLAVTWFLYKINEKKL